jgi:manganese efflux pump family protein
MELLTIILIAFGLSIDSFAISVSSGLAIKRFKLRKVLRISLFLAVFQATMPIIGWILGTGLEKWIKEFDHWLAFLLLLYLGAKMIYEGSRKSGFKAVFNPIKWSVLITMSFATSIDALVIGLSFGLLKLTILLPVLIIGIVTFMVAFSGVYIGASFRKRFNVRGIEIIGGIVLIGIGIKILAEHLTC